MKVRAHPSDRISWMNDTKWRSVLRVVAEERIPCRIKLVFHDYADTSGPGAAVVVAYDQHGKPHFLQPDVVWQAAPKYWDCASLGPFVTRDIDWLAMPTSVFEAIRSRVPRSLKLAMTSDATVILGYSDSGGAGQ